MLNVAADYADVVRTFQVQKLPPYVAYTEQDSARGIAREDDGPVRVVADARTGFVVERTPPEAHSDKHPTRSRSSVLQYVSFTHCYHPTAERQSAWDGRAAVAFDLAAQSGAACNDQPFDAGTLYADPRTHEPLAITGSETDEGVGVAFSVSYARFGPYVLPASLHVGVKGRGWLFWVRERGDVRYSDYAFFLTRRQSAERQVGTTHQWR